MPQPQVRNALTPRSKTLAGAVGATAAGLLMVIVPQWEGKENDPYLDIVKVPTDCYGHTGADVVMGKRRTDAECEARLQTDLIKHAEPVLACTPQIRDNPYFVASSVSFAFNVGTGAYCSSSVAKNFRDGNNAAACASLDKWVMAGGKRVNGLVKRRAAERKLCEHGL